MLLNFLVLFIDKWKDDKYLNGNILNKIAVCIVTYPEREENTMIGFWRERISVFRYLAVSFSNKCDCHWFQAKDQRQYVVGHWTRLRIKIEEGWQAEAAMTSWSDCSKQITLHQGVRPSWYFLIRWQLCHCGIFFVKLQFLAPYQRNNPEEIVPVKFYTRATDFLRTCE